MFSAFKMMKLFFKFAINNKTPVFPPIKNRKWPPLFLLKKIKSMYGAASAPTDPPP